MKNISFLHAAPRSGNTILSSLLNQNPKINVSAHSLVTDIMLASIVGKDSTMFQNFPDHQSYDNVMSSIFNSYYKDWPGDFIIDRSLVGYQSRFDLVRKYLNEDFKCVVIIRDLFDIFASYLKWADKEPTSYLNEGPVSVKEKIEAIMHKDGLVSQFLLGTTNLYNHHHDNTIFVHYDELVKFPQHIINRIYKFLNIDFFKHDFENIKQFEVNGIKYDDKIYGKNMHTIRSSLKKEDSEKYRSLIPGEIYHQYREINNWLLNIR
tara:strand:- start:2491 stop:3282 length:792 start_codon:yes stop_codon:yes gene_type:complete